MASSIKTMVGLLALISNGQRVIFLIPHRHCVSPKKHVATFSYIAGMEIKFYAWYGDVRKRVVISSYSGAASARSFDVSVDKYHWANVSFVRGRWTVFEHGKPHLTEEDKQYIVEIIEENLALFEDYKISFYSGLQRIDDECEGGTEPLKTTGQ
jgi:hypothetical protein